MGENSKKQTGNINIYAGKNLKMKASQDIQSKAKSMQESAAKGIRDKGKQNGVIHNTAGAVEQKKTTKKKKLKIYIGAFFDGTGNNRFNSDAVYYKRLGGEGNMLISKNIPKEKEISQVITNDKGEEETVKVKVASGSSHWNNYSNVALLYDLYDAPPDKGATIKRQDDGTYKLQIKQYIEGIGTKQGMEDDVEGSAFGEHDKGMHKRMIEGCKKIAAQLKAAGAFGTDYEIVEMKFDVFGFSRGAAAARYFANEVLTVKNVVVQSYSTGIATGGIPMTKDVYAEQYTGGTLGKQFEENNVKYPQNTRVRYLGVFDTVISQMIKKKNIDDYARAMLAIPVVRQVILWKSDVLFAPEVKVSTKTMRGLEKCVHLVAADEWRENFAVTPANHATTISMLGAHSDIGGGYAQMDVEQDIITYFDVNYDSNLKKKGTIPQAMEDLKQWYINQGYCTKEQIDFFDISDHVLHISTNSPYMGGSGVQNIETENDAQLTNNFFVKQYKTSDHYHLKIDRYVNNKLSLVSMYVMHSLAIKNGIPFYKQYSDSPYVKYKFEYEFSFDVLKKYKDKMVEIATLIDDGKQEERPDIFSKNKQGGWVYSLGEISTADIRKFVHISANFNNLLLFNKAGAHDPTGGMLYTNLPRLSGKTAKEGLYEREIYNHD